MFSRGLRKSKKAFLRRCHSMVEGQELSQHTEQNEQRPALWKGIVSPGCDLAFMFGERMMVVTCDEKRDSSGEITKVSRHALWPQQPQGGVVGNVASTPGSSPFSALPSHLPLPSTANYFLQWPNAPFCASVPLCRI